MEDSLNIADTLTAQLQTAGKDITMASAAEGRARHRETYYHVRWPWIVVAVAEVVATAVLLGVSIFLTRRQPLLKASSMALLAFWAAWLDGRRDTGRGCADGPGPEFQGDVGAVWAG